MESSVHRTAGLQIVTSVVVGALGYVLQGDGSKGGVIRRDSRTYGYVIVALAHAT